MVRAAHHTRIPDANLPAFLSFISATLLGWGTSACEGAEDTDGVPLQNEGDAGADGSPSSGDRGDTTPGTEDAGSDAGRFAFITSAKCDDLPRQQPLRDDLSPRR